MNNDMISNKEKLRQQRTNCMRPEREGQYWSDEDKAILTDGYYDGLGYSEMALKLQRSETAITNMIEILDLPQRKMHPKRAKKKKNTLELPLPDVCLSPACPFYSSVCNTTMCCESAEEG